MCNPCHRRFPHSHNTIPLIRQSNGKSIQHWKAANPLGNPSNSERLQSHIKFQPQTRYPVKYAITIQYVIPIFKSTIQNENTDYREVRLPDSETFRTSNRFATIVQKKCNAVGIQIRHMIMDIKTCTEDVFYFSLNFVLFFSS